MKTSVLKKDSKSGFLYLDGINRPICPGQVTKLAKSINKMGCIRPIVVAKIKFLTGKDEWYIIDGQHLFNALLRNNMDIPYVEIEISDKKELIENISLLNASSKSWSILDYVNAWCSVSDDYKKLRNYYNIYDFDLGILASILYGGTVSARGTTKIKSGDFKVSNESKSVQILDYLTDILKIAPRMNRFENKYLCSEYVSFLQSKWSDYKHSDFLKRLEKRKKDLILATQEHGKLSKLFENI